MKRFSSPGRFGLRAAAVLLIAASTLTLGAAPEAAAAAPGVTLKSTTVLTTTGRTALTYTGYMNGESFQQDAIVTYKGWQYATFWDQAGYVNISRRKLAGDGPWQNIQLTTYKTTSTDSHNVISMGIAPDDGTIHLAYDMHATQLRYLKSVNGLANNPDSATWSPASFGANQTALTGPNQKPLVAPELDRATYPQFVAAPDNRLQLTIRTGTSGAGDQQLYEYGGGYWTALGTFIDGISTDQNAYLFGFQYDNSKSVLHMTWTVRETPNASTNHDLFYAYSTDKGRSWRNNAGAVVATTGSKSLAASSPDLKVWSIGQNRGLINQESQTVDSAGGVHVLASHLPDTSPDQTNFTAARETAVLVHYYRAKESPTWKRTVTPFLERSSRGDIVVDRDDNLYVVSGDSKTKKLHISTASKASNWSDWTLRHTSAPQYFSDPLIDHDRMRSDNVLSFFTPRHGGSVIEVQDWTIAPGSGGGPDRVLAALEIDCAAVDFTGVAPAAAQRAQQDLDRNNAEVDARLDSDFPRYSDRVAREQDPAPARNEFTKLAEDLATTLEGRRVAILDRAGPGLAATFARTCEVVRSP